MGPPVRGRCGILPERKKRALFFSTNHRCSDLRQTSKLQKEDRILRSFFGDSKSETFRRRKNEATGTLMVFCATDNKQKRGTNEGRKTKIKLARCSLQKPERLEVERGLEILRAERLGHASPSACGRGQVTRRSHTDCTRLRAPSQRNLRLGSGMRRPKGIRVGKRSRTPKNISSIWRPSMWQIKKLNARNHPFDQLC